MRYHWSILFPDISYRGYKLETLPRFIRYGFTVAWRLPFDGHAIDGILLESLKSCAYSFRILEFNALVGYFLANPFGM